LDDSFLRGLARNEGPSSGLPTKKSAGVAVIILEDPGDGDEVLLITRAERQGDPWSGHVSFPGGMVDPGDRSFKETAMRETAEEVGIDLSPEHATFLGYMHEFRVRTRGVRVVPSVFRIATAPVVTLNAEATSHAWVPLRLLARDDARAAYVVRREGSGEELTFPSFVYREFVIWGLTERILSAILGRGTASAGKEGGEEEKKVLRDVEGY
jgi:8-oxo-dGTP pyrophosphatase MutT (NUDIX family)